MTGITEIMYGPARPGGKSIKPRRLETMLDQNETTTGAWETFQDNTKD